MESGASAAKISETPSIADLDVSLIESNKSLHFDVPFASTTSLTHKITSSITLVSIFKPAVSSANALVANVFKSVLFARTTESKTAVARPSAPAFMSKVSSTVSSTSTPNTLHLIFEVIVVDAVALETPPLNEIDIISKNAAPAVATFSATSINFLMTSCIV